MHSLPHSHTHSSLESQLSLEEAPAGSTRHIPASGAHGTVRNREGTFSRVEQGNSRHVTGNSNKGHTAPPFKMQQ